MADLPCSIPFKKYPLYYIHEVNCYVIKGLMIINGKNNVAAMIEGKARNRKELFITNHV